MISKINITIVNLAIMGGSFLINVKQVCEENSKNEEGVIKSLDMGIYKRKKK